MVRAGEERKERKRKNMKLNGSKDIRRNERDCVVFCVAVGVIYGLFETFRTKGPKEEKQ